MSVNIKKSHKDYESVGTQFSPCVTDGKWFISHWDVIDTSINKSATYIFGTDGVEATFYNKNNPSFKLEDLVYDTLIQYLERQHIENKEFKTGLHRFEFDGQQFNYCKETPEWASYDCGTIED